MASNKFKPYLTRFTSKKEAGTRLISKKNYSRLPQRTSLCAKVRTKVGTTIRVIYLLLKIKVF